MDVDSLGKRFIVGFETIVVYKEFSEKVKDFLENYISGRNGTYSDEKLLDEKDHKTGMPYGECLNVIYAGGNDLFIVGHWDRFIDFAELIHSKTKEHFEEDCYMDAGTMRYISISGGIAIVKPKFPLQKQRKWKAIRFLTIKVTECRNIMI